MYKNEHKDKRTRHKQTHKKKPRPSGARSKNEYKRERLMKAEGRCVLETIDKIIMTKCFIL